MKEISKICAVVFLVSVSLMIIIINLPAMSVSADESEPGCWALFVGLSEYEYLDSSTGCAEGATLFYEIISTVWGTGQCKLLTDEEATKYNIKEAVKWIADNAGKDDTVLIYYAAHGDPRGFLSTYSALYVDSWISTVELERWLKSIDSDRIAIIVDSCHSGRFSTALAGEGRVVLTSSKYDEISWVYADIGGIFTSFLLEGLEETFDPDANYNVATEELFGYAENRTIDETEKITESIQHPMMSDGYEGGLSLLTLFVFSMNPMEDMKIVLTIDDKTYEHVRDMVEDGTEILLSPGSEHVVGVTPFYENNLGSRYTFVSWEHGDTSPVINVSEGGLYTAIYDPEYMLNIESPYGNPEGQGWYKADTIAIASIENYIDTSTTRRYFTGWSGNDSKNEAMIEIIMNAPKNLKAEWRSEYLLTIQSTYGEPTGGGWYEEGAEAKVEIQSVNEATARHHFTGWSGDHIGQEESFKIIMDLPKTINTNWASEYLLTIDSEYGEPTGAGWYKEGDIAKVAIESVETRDTRHYFRGWSGDYTGNENSLEIAIDSAKSLTANWHSEYLLSIESTYGEPAGAGWYDEGTTATISVPRSNGLIVRKLFDGWRGDFQGASATTEIKIDKAMLITAEWRTDYLQLYLLFAGLIIVATGIILVFRLRRS